MINHALSSTMLPFPLKDSTKAIQGLEPRKTPALNSFRHKLKFRKVTFITKKSRRSLLPLLDKTTRNLPPIEVKRPQTATLCRGVEIKFQAAPAKTSDSLRDWQKITNKNDTFFCFGILKILQTLLFKFLRTMPVFNGKKVSRGLVHQIPLRIRYRPEFRGGSQSVWPAVRCLGADNK